MHNQLAIQNKNNIPFFSTENIGISRGTDKKWINQYSALFCVLNNIGQIVTWRLTSSVMFSSVEGLLVTLRDRLAKQGVKVKEFYVDNCCSWRLKLQSVFGPDLRVVLDIFHAVKRIGDKIPKRHELRSACMDELRMVLRDPSDRGLERTMATPAPGWLNIIQGSTHAYMHIYNHIHTLHTYIYIYTCILTYTQTCMH